MTEHKAAPAYLANFRMGAFVTVSDRADLISRLVIYMVLLLIFWSIFNIMPLEKRTLRRSHRDISFGTLR